MFAVIAVCVYAADNNDHKTQDILKSDDTIDDFSFDYSQYDVLKTIVSKLNSHGGTIMTTDREQYDFSTNSSFLLKDDLLIVSTGGGNEIMIFHIRDIRLIVVN